MLTKLQNLIEKAKELDLKTIEAIEYFIFGIIIADLFGLYYLLEWKSIAVAILIVCIIAFALLFSLGKKKLWQMPDKQNKVKKEVKKMPEETENKEDKEDKQEPVNKEEPEQEESQGLGMDMNMDIGLPSSEEFNKRMEEALPKF